MYHVISVSYNKWYCQLCHTPVSLLWLPSIINQISNKCSNVLRVIRPFSFHVLLLFDFCNNSLCLRGTSFPFPSACSDYLKAASSSSFFFFFSSVLQVKIPDLTFQLKRSIVVYWALQMRYFPYTVSLFLVYLEIVFPFDRFTLFCISLVCTLQPFRLGGAGGEVPIWCLLWSFYPSRCRRSET